MITFKLDGYETKMPNWAKHHKQLGLHVKRVYEDGEVIEGSEEIKELVKKHESSLKEKYVHTRNRKTGERRGAVDYYLPIYNQEYTEANLEQFSAGASNTTQTNYIRMKFQFDGAVCFLETKHRSSGSYSFIDMIDGIDSIEELVEGILRQGKSIEEIGIKGVNYNDEEDDDFDEDYDEYEVLTVDEALSIMPINIEKREFYEGLVGIEIFKHEMEIK